MNIDTIISSDLKRAVDTAEILNLKAQMDINATPMLRERDWGKLTGCSIKDVKGMDFPSSVESVENMYARAAQFINTTYEKYDGKAVLVVSHGLFIRCIIGVASQLKIREVPRMANAEMRVLTIEKPIVAANPTEDSEASAS